MKHVIPAPYSYGNPAAMGGAAAVPPALVQSASGTTADGSAGLTVNFGVPVTAGNSVIALISYGIFDGDFATSPTLVGGGASVLSSVADVSNEDGALRTRIYKKTNATGGETGVTYTLNDAARASMQILEVSGLADAAAEDTSTNSDSSTTPSALTVTPTSANNLVVAMYASGSGAAYVSGPSNGFTRVGTGTGGGDIFQEVGYLIQSSAINADTAWVISAGRPWATAAAVFGGA